MYHLSSIDWVDVANDLLSKCQLNLRLRKVTDCDASVFVALYEAILGENVPGKFLNTDESFHCPLQFMFSILKH